MKILNYYLKKLKGNPFSLIKRAFTKTLIEPFKYATKDDYKAEEFWQNRHSKFGMNILGPGDQTDDVTGNVEKYDEAKRIFKDLIKQEIDDISNCRILEIGCGNGFYTEILSDLGAKNYQAYDIVDVLFGELSEKFPNYSFQKKDVSTEKIEGKYDLVIMIDVIQHIVHPDKFKFAINNIKEALDKNGRFFITPIGDKNIKHLYYVRFWSESDIKNGLEGFEFSDLIPYRFSDLLIAKNG